MSIKRDLFFLWQGLLRVFGDRVAGVQPGLKAAQDGIDIGVTLLHQ